MKRRLTQALGGALVFATFGCAWGAYGTHSLGRTDEPWLLGIPMVVTLVLIVTLMKLQRRVEALPSDPANPEAEQREARGRRIFGAVNLALVVAVVLAVRYWSGTPTPECVAPTVAFLVGLHFVALARPMETPTHWIVGGLMVLFAFGAVMTAPRQSWAAVIGLGNAAILWGCYTLRIRFVSHAVREA